MGIPLRAAGILLLAITMGGCGNDVQRTVDHAATGATAAQATTTTAAIPQTAVASTVLPPQPSFDFLLRHLPAGLELIGFDKARDRSFVDSRSADGQLARRFIQNPKQRVPLDLVDDGDGRIASETHTTIWGPNVSLDFYGNGHGVSEVSMVGSDADVLLGRTPARVDVDIQTMTLLIEDATDQPDANHTKVLRQHMFDGSNAVLDWIHEFDAPIVTSFYAGESIVVVTSDPAAPWDPTPHEIHLLDFSGATVRTMPAPGGLVWIQGPPRELLGPPGSCDYQEFLFPGGLGWVLNTTDFTVTACRDDEPIGTTEAGPGEVFFSIDANNDGIEELVVGGTSIAGGGGVLYSLVDDVLSEIQDDEGNQLAVSFGHVNGTFADYGCKDDQLVRIRLTADGALARSERSFYSIDGHRATLTNTEATEWQLETPPGEPWGLETVWDEGPPQTADLTNCGPRSRPSFDRIIAVRDDGTFLLSTQRLDFSPSAPCEEQSPLITWKDGIYRTVGWVSGTAHSGWLANDGSLRLRVKCEGEYGQVVKAQWGEDWIDTEPPDDYGDPEEFVLAGDSGATIGRGPWPDDFDCEMNYELPPVLLRSAEGMSSAWTLPNSDAVIEALIEPGHFVSTADGRFAYIDTSTCLHEGPRKSIISGTYDPASGRLLTHSRVETPKGFRTERYGWQVDFPDLLSIDANNQIIAWLGRGDAIVSLSLDSGALEIVASK